MRLLLASAALLLLTIHSAGCSRTPPAKPTAKGSGTSGAAAKETSGAGLVAPLASVQQGAPITDAEALALGQALEAAAVAADSAAFSAQFDWAAFGELVAGNLPASSSEERAFQAGIKAGVKQAAPQLVAQIVSQFSGAGTYQLLGVRDREDGKRVLFRALRGDGGLNYHEVCLARRGGQVRGADVFIYLSGERLSETILRTMLAAMPPEKLTFLSRLQGKDKASLADIQKLAAITTAWQTGQHQQALDLYRSLPPVLQREKSARLMRIMAAQHVSEREHLAAIDDYRAAYPGDASLDLISLDSHILRKNYDAAFQALDGLGQALGGDPYLETLRGNVLVQAGQPDEAQAIGEKQLKEDPRNLHAHWLLVTVSLGRKDFAATGRLLTRIERDFELQLNDLAAVPAYADFVASPEFAKWNAGRRK